jgi:hypothetical protein
MGRSKHLLGRVLVAPLALAAAVATGACSSEDEGTVSLAFSVTNGVRQSPNLVSPLAGDVYGALYLSHEVTLLGPLDGAEAVGSVEASGVDLTTDETTPLLWTSDPLPADEEYTFLGFFDLSGDGGVTFEPAPGDPVTLPVSNRFTIEAGQDLDVTVVFDLVFN